MGLGRLNPGCLCTCEQIPTDPCPRAGYYYRPIGVQINCQSFGGIPLYVCGTTPWPTCGTMEYNASAVRSHFLEYDNPGFECSVTAVSQASYLSSPSCYGLWEIYSDSGGRKAFFVNSGPAGTTFFNPYIAKATGYVELVDSITNRYAFGVRITAIAQLAVSASYISFTDLGAWTGLGFPSGNNWYLSNLESNAFRTLWQFRSYDAKSTYQVTLQSQVPGFPFFPPWCGFGMYHYITIESSTGYTIYSDDPPALRNQRTFEIWQPDPPLDGLGLTTGATGTISLGI